MSASIFLVIASDYEASCVLAAFEAKRDADSLVAACNAYEQAERPQLPPIEDTRENDALFDKAFKKLERWQNKHPGGKDAHGYDTFVVCRIRLRAASKTGGAS